MTIMAIDPGGTKLHAYATFNGNGVGGVGFLANDVSEWPHCPLFLPPSEIPDHFVVEGAYVNYSPKLMGASIRMAQSSGEIVGAIKVLTGKPVTVIPPLEWLRHWFPNNKSRKKDIYKPVLIERINGMCWDLIKTLSTAQRDDIASAVHIGLYYQHKMEVGHADAV